MNPSLRDLQFMVLDLETTGFEPATDRVVELGYCFGNQARLVGGPASSCFVKPHREIPATAMAVHHITEEMVADGLELHEAVAPLIKSMDTTGVHCVVAHHAAFDRAFLPDMGRPWLCSLRLARRLWPEAPSRNLQVLRYWLGLDRPELHRCTPHRAGFDAFLSAILFQRELLEVSRAHADIETFEDLMAFCWEPTEEEVSES